MNPFLMDYVLLEIKNSPSYNLKGLNPIYYVVQSIVVEWTK